MQFLGPLSMFLFLSPLAHTGTIDNKTRLGKYLVVHLQLSLLELYLKARRRCRASDPFSGEVIQEGRKSTVYTYERFTGQGIYVPFFQLSHNFQLHWREKRCYSLWMLTLLTPKIQGNVLSLATHVEACTTHTNTTSEPRRLHEWIRG